MVPHPVAWPDEPWVDLVNIAKEEFEVDNAIAVFSTRRVQEEDSNEFRLILDACMADRQSARLLHCIPEGDCNPKLKLLQRGNQRNWFKEDKMSQSEKEKERGGKLLQ